MRIGVVGAGIAGLAFAHAVRRRRADVDVVVWESADRVGGRIGTTREAGYLVERAANAFLPSATAARALVADLGLEGDVVPADPLAARRFVYARAALHPFPSGPGSLLTCGAISPLARLRVALEPLFATRHLSEETIHAYAARHIGGEAAHVLLGAAVRGIFAGDSHRLSLDAAFPQMRAMEAAHRSLIVAQARMRKSGGGGTLWSLRAGIGSLIDALRDTLARDIHTAAPVAGIAWDAGGLTVRFADGRTDTVDALALATPLTATATLLAPHDPIAATILHGIEQASVSVVALGVEARALARPLTGYGFLTAPGENLPALGVLVDSLVFPGRAPDGSVLLRVMLGGVEDPGHVTLTDDYLIDRAVGVVRRTMGLHGAPGHVWLHRHAEAIPQYTLGHAARIADVRARTEAVLPGVRLLGNAFDGVSVGMIVESASRAAGEMLPAIV